MKKTMRQIQFSEFESEDTRVDLYVDAEYLSNGLTHSGGDVLSKLMKVGIGGGFRPKNDVTQKQKAYVVIESTGKHLDWIDTIDIENGEVWYYGDNREPGSELHKPFGNQFLKDIFEKLQSNRRDEIPPIFLFSAITNAKNGRNRKFVGLLVPGSNRINPEEGLVAIWRNKKGLRYQNYRACFTILDEPKISRDWINDLVSGVGLESSNAPQTWQKWIQNGVYTPLTAKDSVLSYRTVEEQLPQNKSDFKLLQKIHEFFKDDYFNFERCAISILQLSDSRYHDIEQTRNVRDGGRDAVGLFRVGKFGDGIDLTFSLEAKCYTPGNFNSKKGRSSVGVRELARLISRIRHREFGVLVTTSFVDNQAYQELRDDGHPIVIIAGNDILNILRNAGIKTAEEINQWLNTNFS